MSPSEHRSRRRDAAVGDTFRLQNQSTKGRPENPISICQSGNGLWRTPTMQTRVPKNAITSRISGTLVLSLRTSPSTTYESQSQMLDFQGRFASRQLRSLHCAPRFVPPADWTSRLWRIYPPFVLCRTPLENSQPAWGGRGTLTSMGRTGRTSRRLPGTDLKSRRRCLKDTSEHRLPMKVRTTDIHKVLRKQDRLAIRQDTGRRRETCEWKERNNR